MFAGPIERHSKASSQVSSSPVPSCAHTGAASMVAAKRSVVAGNKEL
jgi:hypothetical protein